MKKLTLIFSMVFCSTLTYAQHDFFIFKKNSQNIKSYYKDSYIAFQMADKQWQSGYITKIQNDSFWMIPTAIHYNVTIVDTVHYDEQAYSFSDVYAMPKKGVQIDFINGSFQITTSGGHVHWYWIKSGWVFRVGAAGYAALYTINGLLQHNFIFSASTFGISAGIFLFGVLLKHLYSPVLRMGKKYHFKTIRVSR